MKLYYISIKKQGILIVTIAENVFQLLLLLILIFYRYIKKNFQGRFFIISRVPNAKAGRDLFDISIYGMDGVPIELINMKLSEKVELKKKRANKERGYEENEEEEKMDRKKSYKKKKKEEKK